MNTVAHYLDPDAVRHLVAANHDVLPVIVPPFSCRTLIQIAELAGLHVRPTDVERLVAEGVIPASRAIDWATLHACLWRLQRTAEEFTP